MTITRVICGVVAVGLIQLWHYFGHAPAQKELALLHGQVAASQAQLTDFQTTVAQLPALIEASAAMNNQKQRQASVLFGKNEVLRLIEEIRGLAAGQRLTITDIEPPVSELLALRAVAATPGEPMFLNITVRLRGDYIGFGRFVEHIEMLPYFRGANFCSIIGSPDQSTPPVYALGFRALLGEGRPG